MIVSFRRDSAGIREILTKNCRDVISSLGREVGNNVRGSLPDATAEVVVDDYTTDRAASSVTIRDVRARAWQVQFGILSKAAGRAGLQVTTRSGA